MLYHLLYEWLQPHFGPLNVFRYITVRTAFAGLTALLLMLVLGPWMIRRLRAFQVGQFVREEDRKSTRLNSSHIQKSRMPSSA